MKRYRGHMWRVLDDGSEAGKRVLTRQVTDGEDEYTQIAHADGVHWRRATEADRFKSPRSERLPQIDTEWVT